MKTKKIIGGVVLGVVLCAIVIVVSLVLGDRPWLFKPGGDSESQSSDSAADSDADIVERDGLRGVWVASVLNLDFPSSADRTAAQLKAEIDEIVENAKDWGLNAIFLQVRPASDALYKSEIFPVSVFLSSDRTLPEDFDPLAYAVEQAHAAGLELHAWVNPLRVTTGNAENPQTDLAALPENSPARQNPDWTVAYADGKVYFDAGYPEVRRLVTDGVLEIVNNYAVDGIHFDDYFYPSPFCGETFDDSASFALYGEERELADYRRDNITALITQVYAAIKAADETVQFGVSPFAIWQDQANDPQGSNTAGGVETYSDLYADTRKWVKDEILDYICPQIYWSLTQNGFEYGMLYDWWRDCVADTGVKLVVGHAVYKVGTEETGWDDPQEILNQIAHSDQSGGYGGSIFYRYAFLAENPLAVTESLSTYYAQQTQPAAQNQPQASSDGQSSSTEPPASSELILTNTGINYGPPPTVGTGNNGQIHIGYGGSGFSIAAAGASIIGAANPSLALYCDGEPVTMTAKGFFSVYKSLNMGANTFTFTQGGAVKTYTVTRTSPSGSGGSTAEYWNVFPESDCINTAGSVLDLSISTRSDCTVTAVLLDKEYPLTKQVQGGAYVHSLSTADLPAGTGRVTYILQYSASQTRVDSEGEVTVYEAGRPLYVEVTAQSPMIRHTTTNVVRWNVPVPTGTVLKADRLKNGYYDLSDFGLISQSQVQQTSETLAENYIFAARITESEDAFLLDFLKTGSKAVDIKTYRDAIKFVVYGQKASGTPAIEFLTAQKYPNLTATRFEDRVEYVYTFAKRADWCGFELEHIDDGVRVHIKRPGTLSENGEKPLAGLRIALNFGHGPNSGAPGPMGGNGWVEDQFNWDITLRVKDYLENLGAAVDLVSTMENSITIQEVVVDYEKGDYDIAVSIHFNAVMQSTNVANVQGVWAYYAYPTSYDLAKYLADGVCDETGRLNKGPIRDSMYVTRTYTCPSVLMEMEYICNPAVYDWMCEGGNRDAMARGLVRGIYRYFVQASI